VIGDIDDHPTPPKGHGMANKIIAEGIPKKIIEAMNACDYVTTTTSIFEEYIKEKMNPNTKVIPNAPDTTAKMWQEPEKEIVSDRVRVAWIGGSSHLHDLEILRDNICKVYADTELKDKIQFVMCGYDIRGKYISKNETTGKEQTRKIKPKETVWVKFENIFTAGGMADENQYVRKDTMPITRFGAQYDNADIVLAPLVENEFNKVKSELKIVEAGAKRKALICSDVYMYNQLLTHGVNAMLVEPRKNHKGFYKHIRKLVLDPDMRKELANNLHDLVIPKYTLEEVTKERVEWYKSIIRKT
jgi:glycosyltransferase involved in cell wall biosynthesis